MDNYIFLFYWIVTHTSKNMAQELSAQVVKGVQGIGYVCAFLLSLVICVPMSMHQDQFKGRCLLFSTGLWQEKDGQFKVICSIHSTPVCDYTSLIIHNLRISTMNLLKVNKINILFIYRLIGHLKRIAILPYSWQLLCSSYPSANLWGFWNFSTKVEILASFQHLLMLSSAFSCVQWR